MQKTYTKCTRCNTVKDENGKVVDIKALELNEDSMTCRICKSCLEYELWEIKEYFSKGSK